MPRSRRYHDVKPKLNTTNKYEYDLGVSREEFKKRNMLKLNINSIGLRWIELQVALKMAKCTASTYSHPKNQHVTCIEQIHSHLQYVFCLTYVAQSKSKMLHSMSQPMSQLPETEFP